MSDLTFREEDHTYWLGDTKVPGVNEILQDLGVSGSGFYPEGAAQKGRDIHALTEVFDRGEAIATTPYLPYLMAWLQFKEDTGYEVIATEQKSHHPLLLYAGTVDRRLVIDGEEYLVDIKSGQACRWHELQLIAYGLVHNRPRLLAVYIAADGTYKKKEFNYDKEYVWLSCLSVYRWKHG